MLKSQIRPSLHVGYIATQLNWKSFNSMELRYGNEMKRSSGLESEFGMRCVYVCIRGDEGKLKPQVHSRVQTLEFQAKSAIWFVFRSIRRLCEVSRRQSATWSEAE